MNSNKLAVRLLIHSEKDAVYLWHLNSTCFARSLPSWERATILSQEELPGRQVRIVVLFKKLLFTVRAVFRIHYPIGGQIIRIKEESGTVKSLDFQIEIKSLGENLYELLEKVEYKLSWSWVFPETRKKRFEKRLLRFFDYKHEIMIRDLELLKQPAKHLKILVAGSSGLIGSSLVLFLRAFGHEVFCLVRKKGDELGPFDIYYNIETGEVNRSVLEGFDSVVNLWGTSIQSRWTKKNKQKFFKSRVDATKQLSKILASLQNPPKAFLTASAVGYYSDNGSNWVNEDSQVGQYSFLAQMCRDWENASATLEVHGIRVVNLRFGVVLSSKKGALYEMVKMLRLGLLGVLGKGDQYISWIAIDDAVGSIYHAIQNQDIEGPLNICSPHPISNGDFTKSISTYLKKPLGPNVPASVLRFLKGEMADELLLSSIKACPKKLLETGYRFQYPNIEDALPHLID